LVKNLLRGIVSDLIKIILSHPEIIANPPVLVDIRAYGQIHPKLAKIAKHSVCIAFDADEREFKFVEKEQSNCRKLYIYNCIVSDKDSESANFYLTNSPYCSSTLEPDLESLKSFSFAPLFNIDKIIKTRTISLQNALNNLNIRKIDWFKSDSQGIDLRLFKNLNENLRDKVILTEFEPGIIDSYKGEDKLYSILDFMQHENFWISDIKIKGVPRIESDLFNAAFPAEKVKKLIKESIKPAPAWAEVTFINSFKEDNNFTAREYLLGWLFCCLEDQHSFAYSLAIKGYKKFQIDLFKQLENYSLSMMWKTIVKLRFLPGAIRNIKHRFRRL